MAEQALRRRYVVAALSTMLVWGLEYYDVIIYSSVAPIIEKTIIGGDPFSSALKTWFGFAIAFLARPLGALLFGYVGDRAGRRLATVLTSLLVGLATMGIGLLPPGPSLADTLLLYLLRVIQGLGLGGEAGGGATWALELTPARVRPYLNGIMYSGLSWAFLLSYLVTLELRSSIGAEAFSSYGWRILYITGVIPAAIALFIRLLGPESGEWLRSHSTKVRVPIFVVFSKHWRSLLVLILINLGLTVYNYAGPGYWAYTVPSLVAPRLHMDPNAAYSMVLLAGALGGVGAVLGEVASGFLVNGLGIRGSFIAGGILLLALTVPTTYLLFTMNPYAPWLALTLGVAFGLAAAPQTLYFTSLFPVEVRWTAISFGWNISASVGIVGSGLVMAMLQGSPSSPLLLTLSGSLAPLLGVLLLIMGALVGGRVR